MAQLSAVEKINHLLAQVKTLGASDSLSVEDRAAVQQSLLETLAHTETPYEHMLRLSGSVSRPFQTALERMPERKA